MSPGILVGGLIAGAGMFALIKGPALGIVFALFVGYSATQMLINRKPRATRVLPPPGRRPPSAAASACCRDWSAPAVRS